MQRTTTLLTVLPLCALLAAAVGGTGCSNSLNPSVHDSIRTQMKMQRRGLARCYGKALKHNRRTRGRVTLSFTVSEETGEFTKVRVVKRSVRDRKLIRCLTRRARRLRSDPKPTKPVDVLYTVDFRPAKKKRRRRSRVAAAEENAPFIE